MDTPDVPQKNNSSTNVHGLMDSSDIAISEPDTQNKIITSSLDDFQNNFHLFPLGFDTFCFDHWYWLIIGFIVPFIMLIITFDVRYAQLCPQCALYYDVNSVLSNWMLLSLVVALSLALLTFNTWRRNIPSTFQALLNKRRIYAHNQDTEVAQEYRTFLNAYQSTLLSHKRYVVIAIPVIFTFIFQLYIWSTWSNFGRWDALLSIDNWLTVILIIVAYLFISYFFGIGIWAMGVTGLYVKKLTEKFELTILYNHPDNCGGLKILGNFCLGMAIPILIGAIFLGIWSIGVSIHEGINNIFAYVFLIVFTLPLAAIAFFVPLWNIHNQMIKKRDVDYDNFAALVEKVEEKIQSALHDGSIDEAKVARDEMEIVQALNPGKIGYPTWPFDRRILLTFLAPQIIPILSLIVQIIPRLMK
jgi:hypothetical protein